jgi:rSAM/selenodomain-associated transferase 2/rSAM/selenodomain-associated transferase 1
MRQKQDTHPDRLIVFGRYPAPGKTKTRLIPLLGAARAADFQRALTEKTVRTDKAFARRQGVAIEACFEGCDGNRLVRWLGSGLVFSPQGGEDLGQRMGMAFRKAFQESCRRVVLHGTDIPGLSVHHLQQAFEALREKDLVLGPSTDGGYWLIGLKRYADLFRGLEWGTPSVFAKTVGAAQHLNLSFHVLEPLTDMDTSQAVKESMPEWAEPRPYLSVIIPALNEASLIEDTIAHARNDDAEIIVVDGGSTDDTVEKASRAGARIIKASRGRALQMNQGAASAKGGVLLFLHADTRLPPNYVAHVFETLMEPRVCLGAFRFKTDRHTSLMKVIEHLTNFRSSFMRLPYGDQALFVRRTFFEKMGGFPAVPIAEDLFFVRQGAKHARIALAGAEAITSSRRWVEVGVLKTTLINQLVLAGLFLGISPSLLSFLYRRARTPRSLRFPWGP